MTANNPTPEVELVERLNDYSTEWQKRAASNAVVLEAAAAIASLTAERDHFKFNHKVCFDAHSSAMDRAIAADKRVKELEVIRDSHSRDADQTDKRVLTGA